MMETENFRTGTPAHIREQAGGFPEQVFADVPYGDSEAQKGQTSGMTTRQTISETKTSGTPTLT